MKKIYLCGPIEGTEGNWWRETATKFLNPFYILFDPTRRPPYALDSSPEAAKFMVENDLRDIDNSDIILVFLKELRGRCWGTVMEIMYSHVHNKRIVLVADDLKHPFIDVLVKEKYSTLEEALETLKKQCLEDRHN